MAYNKNWISDLGSSLLENYVTNIPGLGMILKAFGVGSMVKGAAQDALSSNEFQSWVADKTQSGLTGRDIAINQQNLNNLHDQWIYNVKGMQDAGLNTALMYQNNGTSGTSLNNGGSAGSLSSLLSLAMLPAQIKLLNAQAKNVNSQTEYTKQRTLTEAEITKIQGVAAEYSRDLTETQINEWLARTEDYYSQIDLRTSNKDLIDNQADAQWITNKYLDKKFKAEIDSIEATTEKLSSDSALNKAREVYQNWFNNFVDVNGFLPSSNDAVMLATYIASIFGVDKPDIMKMFKDSLLTPKNVKKHWNNARSDFKKYFAKNGGSR